VQPVRDALSIIKFPISAMSAFAALLGFLAAGSPPYRGAGVTALCVFALAAGASALNNIQDRAIDALMPRTSARPLPANRVHPRPMTALALLLIAAGSSGLVFLSPAPQSALAGIAAVILYNVLYTPLKKKTQLALIPGVACGVMPFVIGWLATGSGIAGARPWGLVTMFAVWQIPHFWLLILAHREDYRAVKIRTLLDTIPEPVMHRLLFIWAAGFAVVSLCALYYGGPRNGVLALLVIVSGIAIPPVFGACLALWRCSRGYRFLFHYLNLTACVIIGAFIIDALMFAPNS
jgi:heme o synthase